MLKCIMLIKFEEDKHHAEAEKILRTLIFLLKILVICRPNCILLFGSEIHKLDAVLLWNPQQGYFALLFFCF